MADRGILNKAILARGGLRYDVWTKAPYRKVPFRIEFTEPVKRGRPERSESRDNDFLWQNVGIGEIVEFFEAFVSEPEDIKAGVVGIGEFPLVRERFYDRRLHQC